MTLLSVERLTVGFPAAGGWAPVVRRLSFEIDRGEAVGLVGESGCGKSMTALAVLGLIPAPGRQLEGTVRFDGEPVSGAAEPRRRGVRGKRIGLVLQEPARALDPLFTVGWQLLEAIRAHRALDRREARRAAVDLFGRVALPDPEAVFATLPHRLSGGQRQRALIALALAGEPDLLIADEPTTALDVTIQAQVLELLERLRQELGLAILLISHDLSVVAESCQRLMVMYAGEAVEKGDTAALFGDPLHPYTRGLLAATPRLGRPDLPLPAIAGRVPPPDALPPGCAFEPRCPEARARCRAQPVELLRAGAERAVRCVLHDGSHEEQAR